MMCVKLRATAGITVKCLEHTDSSYHVTGPPIVIKLHFNLLRTS